MGSGAAEFHVGQLVAAAGNEYALHAEYNWIPVNMCVPVPRDVAPEHAAFSTVGAIAMQGVRQAEVQLGETACVIGLGLVGQLAVRLLIAAGVRVVGLDLNTDRCQLAEQAGAVRCGAPEGEGLAAVEQALAELTGGRGADHVLLTAGGHSNGPVELAAKLARDRARVVDIGKTRLDLPWNAYYDKELDVRFSRSYGPGRYDDRYELEGIDYPAGYVRWTERRNLECFLDLLARKDIEVQSLINATFPIEKATTAYEDLASGALQAVGVLLEYPKPEERTGPPATSRVVAAGQAAAPGGAKQGQLAVGFIGAGSYATSMLLPHLAGESAVRLAHVATSRSLSAVNAQKRFGFTTASSNAEAVLEDASLDVIFIVTRHHTHADLVCRALETGKAVFVEKPLALTRDEADRILNVAEKAGNDRLMVGFNRRFAPLLREMHSRFGPQAATASTRYLVNAGGWTPPAGISTRSWRARGSPARAGISSTRSAGGRAACPSRFTPCPAPTPATFRPPCGSPTGRPGPSATSRPGTPASPRRRWTPHRAAAAPGSTTSRRPASGPAANAGPARRVAARTRGSEPSLRASSKLSRPVPRCQSHWSPWSRRPAQRSQSARAWTAVTRSRCDCAGDRAARLVCTQSQPDVTG